MAWGGGLSRFILTLLFSLFSFFFFLFSCSLLYITGVLGVEHTYCFLDAMLQTLACAIDRPIYWGRLVRGRFRHLVTKKESSILLGDS